MMHGIWRYPEPTLLAPDLATVIEGYLCNYLPDIKGPCRETRDWTQISCVTCLHEAAARANVRLIQMEFEGFSAITPTIFFADDEERLKQVRWRNKMVVDLLDKQRKLVDEILPRAIKAIPYPDGWAEQIEKPLFDFANNLCGELMPHRSHENCRACRFFVQLAKFTGKDYWAAGA